MIKSLTNKGVFVVKTAGGAAAQLLGLITGIHLSDVSGRRFKLAHYPTSTGTYWPLAIEDLLEQDELLSKSEKADSLQLGMATVGKLLPSHPLRQSGLNKEKVLKVARIMKLEFPLRWLMGELAIETQPSRLSYFSRRIERISGGYFPIINRRVCNELHRRFQRAKLPSPFSGQEYLGDYTVIHYRLGDKRSSREAGLDQELITNPLFFKELLETLSCSASVPLYLVSDEPLLATQLLSSVGIEAKVPEIDDNIWSHIAFMANARNFIGSWSQVSQLVAAIVASRPKSMALLPMSTAAGDQVKWSIEGVQFFKPRYLEESHEIYS